MSPLLEEIEAFIRTHGISPTRFGSEALNDQHFVEDLRNGRRCWPETVERVRNYMVTFRPEAA